MDNERNFVEEQVTKFAFMILGYLKKNPNAMDTIEGITEWWILSENINLNLTNVQNALDTLLAENLIQKKSYNGQRVYYQLNKDKMGDIDKLYHSNKRVYLDNDFSNN